jgi:hypothetical protein
MNDQLEKTLKKVVMAYLKLSFLLLPSLNYACSVPYYVIFNFLTFCCVYHSSVKHQLPHLAYWNVMYRAHSDYLFLSASAEREAVAEVNMSLTGSGCLQPSSYSFLYACPKCFNEIN